MALKLDALSPKELHALIADAKSRVEGAHSQQVKALRKTIEGMIKAEGLELSEVFPALGSRTKKSKRAGAGVPRFRNPADPTQTWTGFGKKPNWFIEALRKRGVTADTLLIDPSRAPAPAKAAKAAKAKKTAPRKASAAKKTARKATRKRA
jgi:DNA-binding protein H-NS